MHGFVNDKVDYACTARLDPNGVKVGPLKNKRLIRDLVTDVVPPKEQFLIRIRDKNIMQLWNAKSARLSFEV